MGWWGFGLVESVRREREGGGGYQLGVVEMLPSGELSILPY